MSRSCTRTRASSSAGSQRRRHHIVGAQVQSTRPHGAASASEENHAGVGGRSQAFDFSKRTATEDIGQVRGKQKHIDRCRFGRRGTLLPAKPRRKLHSLRLAATSWSCSRTASSGWTISMFGLLFGKVAGFLGGGYRSRPRLVPLTLHAYKWLQGIYIVAGNSYGCLNQAWRERLCGRGRVPETRNSIFSKHTDDAALNLKVVCGHHDRSHF